MNFNVNISLLGSIIGEVLIGASIVLAIIVIVYTFIFVFGKGRPTIIEKQDEIENKSYLLTEEKEEKLVFSEIEQLPVPVEIVENNEELDKLREELENEKKKNSKLFAKIIEEKSNQTPVVETEENIDDDEPIIEGPKMPRKKLTFAIKLSSKKEFVKQSFSDIVNLFRNYGFRCRMAKSRETFKFDKVLYGKMVFKGKSLTLCLPLDPKNPEFDESVYHQLDMSEKKNMIETPFGIKITNKKSAALAFELAEKVILSNGFSKKEKYKYIDYVQQFPDIYTDFELKGYGHLVTESVAREEVQNFDDKFAFKTLVEIDGGVAPENYYNAELTISKIANRFTDFDTPITLERLKESRLVTPLTNYVIIKASPKLSAPIKVYANEFELDAVNMINLAGGAAYQVVYTPDENLSFKKKCLREEKAREVRQANRKIYEAEKLENESKLAAKKAIKSSNKATIDSDIIPNDDTNK